MVKGVSRQVIVVNSKEQEFFEQAIFILKDGQTAITDEQLLKEAKKLVGVNGKSKRRKLWLYGPVWATGGAILTGIVWLITALA